MVFGLSQNIYFEGKPPFIKRKYDGDHYSSLNSSIVLHSATVINNNEGVAWESMSEMRFSIDMPRFLNVK